MISLSSFTIINELVTIYLNQLIGYVKNTIYINISNFC